MTHGPLCNCTCCLLARAYDGHTPESDARAQRDMADAWAGIAGEPKRLSTAGEVLSGERQQP